jgi:hypothetical protein
MSNKLGKPLDASCDNVLAWRLAEALNEAMVAKAGDPIDRGLALLRTLRARGFTVYHNEAADPGDRHP